MSENALINNRIARNTIVLYLRMIFILVVGLFTSRIVLNELGIENYGLYNVTGGFVALFAFFNGAMATSTQRFITFELARGDLDRQRIAFSTSLIIHFAIAIFVVVFAETIGLWFVYHKLVIPENRFTAAFWVYQLSIASVFVAIISIPYNAIIIAHEKMSVFAYISIFNVVLKLIIAGLLTIVSWDKLVFYAFLFFLAGLLDRMVLGWYCSKHFTEAKFEWRFDKGLFKEMSNIAGWSLFGNIAGTFYTQGLNVLLNMFFGPAVNAARGIAVIVQGVVSGFVSNFQMALNPQITKSYAVNDLIRMHALIFASSKFSFFLLLLITLPIIIETQTILILWLKIVPEHTVWFLRLILCVMLIDTIANPLMISSQAVGKVKVYQSVVGGLLLLILPISYVVLRLGGKPESVFIVHLCIALVAQCCRIMIVGRMIKLSLRAYVCRVVRPIVIVSVLSLPLSLIYYYIVPDTLLASLGVMIMTVVFTFSMIVTVGLTNNERQMVIEKMKIFKIKMKYHE